MPRSRPSRPAQAIDRGVDYLKREQRRDGSWQEHPTLAGGVTALATLARLNSACRPTTRRFVTRWLTYKIPPKFNYVVCLQTMVFTSPTRRPTRC